MNSSRQMEVHYINTGFPYTVTESFMDLFEGLAYAQADAALTEALQDQGSAYWPMMHASSYKYGFSGLASNSYYSFGHAYDLHDFTPRLDGGRRAWDNPSGFSNFNSLSHLPIHGSVSTDASASPRNEECIRVHHTESSPQVVWQDNIDPDNMTYEELLDLGEAVGTQSRGLSQERISMLPITKYKCSFFSRKKARRERCVICQMNYKRGDIQMTLPCKHVYHAGCVTRWLSINKACPICFSEVPNEEQKHQ